MFPIRNAQNHRGPVLRERSGMNTKLIRLFSQVKCFFEIVASQVIVLLALSSVCYGEEISGSVGMGGENREADVLTVQVLLNQVPAEQGGPESLLDPDGENGPATINAISNFQRKHFAEVDSKIDPNGMTLAKLNQIVEEQIFANRISRIALGEAKFWREGQRNEVDPRVVTRLQAYWAVVGQKVTPEQLKDSKFQEAHPWSAVCISWIVKRAGGGKDFKYSAAHSVYTAAAKKNLLQGATNPFKARDAKTTAIAVGDIIVQPRGNESVTYEDIDDGKPHATHGDIVVAIQDGKAITIGGNVSHSVKQTVVKLNSDGTISSNQYIAVVRRD